MPVRAFMEYSDKDRRTWARWKKLLVSMTSSNPGEADTAAQKVKEFSVRNNLKWEDRPHYLRADIEDHFPGNKFHGQPLSDFFYWPAMNSVVKAKPKTAKKPTPREAEPPTSILEWKDLDARKRTLFEQHTFQAKTESGTYRISPGRDGGHDVIFCKPRKAGHQWEDHAATLDRAKEMARAHAAEALEPDAKPALLTAAQVKASADKPTQRGTPIGELHYLGREIRGRTERLDVLGGKTVNMKDSIDRLLAEAAKLCDRKGFEAFKECYCPEFSESWTYQLLAVQEGRKTLEELRAATRLRVAKHRAAKRDVTESDSVTPAEDPAASDEIKPPAIRLAGGQEVDIEDLGLKAQAQLAEKLATEPKERGAADEQRQRKLAEEQWQCSLTNIAGNAVSLRAFWKKTFGDWEKFEVPTDLLDLAKQAALAWDQLATDLAKDVGLRPARPSPSPEERKAEIERGEGGTFLTDAEYKALTADELRDLIGNLFFGNSRIENFDEFMETTADALREELEHDGIFGCLYGVMRGKDGDLYLYFD
jgi:hypothetical protein